MMGHASRSSRTQQAWAVLLAVLLLSAADASAQQRPLVTEDPETIGAGRLLVEAGFEYAWDAWYPVSRLEGDLLRFPMAGVSIGISSIAELQIDGGWQRLSFSEPLPTPLPRGVDPGDESTSTFEDIVVATKIRFLGETAGRPGMGVRLATKLPIASDESGLGLNTFDFFASLLVGKTVASVRVVGNVGLGTVAHPFEASAQNDMFTYGLSVAGALTDRAEVVGEVNGRLDMREREPPPPGLESRSRLRGGVRYTRGAGRFDAGVAFGLTDADPDFAITAGYTHVFNAFRVP